MNFKLRIPIWGENTICKFTLHTHSENTVRSHRMESDITVKFLFFRFFSYMHIISYLSIIYLIFSYLFYFVVLVKVVITCHCLMFFPCAHNALFYSLS